MSFVPVILAAGESTRIGSPKALLDFDGITCIGLVLGTCRRSRAAAPIVVLGHAAEEIRPALPDGIEVVANPGFRRGQTSSLQAGLRRLPAGAAGFLLFPVDHPLVRPETIDLLLDAPGEIVLPVREGRRGHPARFGRPLVEEFLALAGDRPAHQVVRRDPARIVEVPCDDPGVTMRMNTRGEYLACLEAYRSRSGP